jgi:hypothetical protein
VYWQALVAQLWNVLRSFETTITNESNGYRMMFHVFEFSSYNVISNIRGYKISHTTKNCSHITALRLHVTTHYSLLTS